MGLESGQFAALRSAGRKLAAGLVAAPIFDIADDRGILGGLARADLDTLLDVGSVPWLWLGFFVALAVGFAGLFPRHSPRTRIVFFALVAAPVIAYWLAGGLRLSVVLAILLIALGLVGWSIAGFGARSAE